VSVTVAHTADLDAATLAAAHELLVEAFAGALDDHDWEHCLGGLHVLAWDGEALVGHAAVIQRRLLYDGTPLRAGYVEGMGVAARCRRRGHGAAIMAEVNRIIRAAYAIGGLGATDDGAALYARCGWQVWEGPLAELTPDGIRPTEGEDGYIWVLDVNGDLDRTRPLACDWREGDCW
jgi:aminoglycoside 2'-N-acetyltransferase I